MQQRLDQNTVQCSACGRTSAEPGATWSSQVDERGLTWVCDECTRQHIRSIEGRLDIDWW
jgi:hypothetical protein